MSCYRQLHFLHYVHTLVTFLFRDQRRKSRHRHFKTRRWPLGAIYFFLLDASVANAVVLFKDAGHPDFANADAKPTLVSQLLQHLPTLAGLPATSLESILAEDGRQHFSFGPSATQPQPSSDDLSCGPSLRVQQLQRCLDPVVKRPRAEADSLRLDVSLGHHPRQLPFRGPCVLHSSTRKYSYFWCTVCGIALHCSVCFEAYHTLTDIDGIDL